MSSFIYAAAIQQYSVITADVTPDAVNWSQNTSGAINQTNTQTITGISGAINLRIECYNFQGSSYCDIYINNVQYDMVNDLSNAGIYDIQVQNGDVIYFQRGNTLGETENYTVINLSDSNTVLDTFTFNVLGGG